MKLIDKMLLTHFENRKLKKLEARRQEYIRASKEIMIGITKELIYHDIEIEYVLDNVHETFQSMTLYYGKEPYRCCVGLCSVFDEVRIQFNNQSIALYKHLTWFQHFNLWRKQFKICKKSSITKQYYYTDDAVRALSILIITGVKI